MLLFGYEVPHKRLDCAYNGKVAEENTVPYVNLYVRVTNQCNASCKFCTFKGEYKRFDFNKFIDILGELNETVKINKISFTGGEPTLVTPIVNKSLQVVKELNNSIYTIINSNGLHLDLIDFTNLNSYALSRHTMGAGNNDVFGCKVISDEDLLALPEYKKDKIHFSCNIIKGIVDNQDKMYEYINHYSHMGFHDYGFVTLMDVNEYAKEHSIDFRAMNLHGMKNTKRHCTMNDMDSCFCANYVTFDDDGDLNMWYARHYCDRNRVDSTLVYDNNHLKVGFNGPILVK